MSAFIIFISISILVPIVIVGILKFKYNIKLSIPIIGVLTFFISQIIFRIPILTFISLNYPVFNQSFIWQISLPFTAGIVEVVADYIGFNLIKSSLNEKSAIALGLGHALCENAMIALPIFIAYMTAGSSVLNNGLYISSFERLFAIVLHVACAIFAYYAVKKRKVSLLIYGILLHSLNDLPTIVFMMVGVNNIILIEIIFAILSSISFALACLVIVKDKRRRKILKYIM